MKAPSEEPLTAVILKALGIVSTITAVVYFVKFFMDDGPLDAVDLPQVARAAVNHAGHFYGAVGATASAISLWWMGSMLALLDRIAKNGERQPASRLEVLEKATGRKIDGVPVGKPLMTPTGGDYDDVPVFKL